MARLIFTPDIGGSVVGVDHLRQSRTVTGRGVARGPAADQDVPAIDRDVVLVAERLEWNWRRKCTGIRTVADLWP